jgi:hypothetical protein
MARRYISLHADCRSMENLLGDPGLRGISNVVMFRELQMFRFKTPNSNLFWQFLTMIAREFLKTTPQL